MMIGRQKYTAELLVPEPSAFEVEMASEELKSHKSPGKKKIKLKKSPGIDHIPAELINPLNTKLNCICPLLALFRAHHILYVSR